MSSLNNSNNGWPVSSNSMLNIMLLQEHNPPLLPTMPLLLPLRLHLHPLQLEMWALCKTATVVDCRFVAYNGNLPRTIIVAFLCDTLNDFFLAGASLLTVLLKFQMLLLRD